jgi:hypothetical protein
MPRFDLGQIVATPAALGVLRRSSQTPGEFLRRHVCGDWGELDGHDEKENAIALREGGRLVSAYTTRLGDTIWIITEADRSYTTLLLPSDY